MQLSFGTGGTETEVLWARLAGLTVEIGREGQPDISVVVEPGGLRHGRNGTLDLLVRSFDHDTAEGTGEPFRIDATQFTSVHVF